MISISDDLLTSPLAMDPYAYDWVLADSNVLITSKVRVRSVLSLSQRELSYSISRGSCSISGFLANAMGHLPISSSSAHALHGLLELGDPHFEH